MIYIHIETGKLVLLGYDYDIDSAMLIVEEYEKTFTTVNVPSSFGHDFVFIGVL